MTNQFIESTLDSLKNFTSETVENLKWLGREIQHYHFISTLQSIGQVHPTLADQAESLSVKVEHSFYSGGEPPCPDFVEAPEPESNDGLNEPRYPYDTEPSA
jgi:hypothetical protein